MIDLDYALRFVKNSGDFAGLPIMLFGHSWGAYAAGSVLNLHPDIKAVVMAAGFDNSTDLLDEAGRKSIGGGMSLLMQPEQ